MASLELTQYFDEFVRYYQLAAWQHKNCNLGTKPHAESPFDDDLMKQVYLYDVVERKYAGFTQILLDLWHGDEPSHPYYSHLHEIRKSLATKASTYNLKKRWGMVEWLYIFILHRVTGSAINYAKSPSGYWNTILPELIASPDVEDMVNVIRQRSCGGPFYTSVGYQFPAFPKPTTGYKRGGDYFLCEYAPGLAKDLANYLSKGEKKTLREVGEYTFGWNKVNDLRAYRFQYAAVVADIADFYPETVQTDSLFFYGKNAVEAINYMAVKPPKMNELEFLDAVMGEFHAKTGARPYDAEDVACDCIRWIENYIRPGASYAHLDRDKVFSSHQIEGHPYGRQKWHLDAGLIKSFNHLKIHPSDDYVLSQAGLGEVEYQRFIRRESSRVKWPTIHTR